MYPPDFSALLVAFNAITLKYILSDVHIIGSIAQSFRMKIERECQYFIKNLGRRLRKLRLQRKWTLEETEEHGWPSWRHLQKIEGGKNITLATLWKLADLYGVSPSELLRD